MGAPLPRTAALNARLETPIEEWPYLQAPLLKCRKEIRREEAIKLWGQKRKAGWEVCPPQWTPPPALLPR